MIRSAKLLLLLAALVMASACGGASGGSSSTGPSAVVVATPAPTATPTPTPAATPLATPTPTPTPTATPSGPVTLRRASLSGAAGHTASGTVAIVRDGSSFDLVFQSDFRIDGGVNDVILSNRPDSMDGGQNLGSLRALTGGQAYSMQNDGSDFRYVILWCRPFRVVVGVGELR